MLTNVDVNEFCLFLEDGTVYKISSNTIGRDFHADDYFLLHEAYMLAWSWGS